VPGAAPPSRSDLAQIRELLAAAQGYAVFGREGKRVGAFIELAGAGARKIAIRHDGTFLWRRRLLPITAVASVFPRERAVVLNVDRHSLASSQEAPQKAVVEPSLPAEESAGSSEHMQRRIARYLSSGQWETDQANHDHADAARKPSIEGAAPERPLPAPALELQSEDVDPPDHSVAGHLVFISSPRGYTLVELEGPPPALGEEIDLPAKPGSFRVTKLGPSPFPGDPRSCAYLERTREGTVGRETAE
jgi:hypothetical protein